MRKAIRILFIGELNSSHALSWIDLLSPFKEEFEIQGLHTSQAPPPKVTFQIINIRLNDFELFLSKYISLNYQYNNLPYIHGYGRCRHRQFLKIDHLLKSFKPHIVHTLGIFPASVFFLKALALNSAICRSVWIVQARGGPDMALNHNIPELKTEIKAILGRCDYFIADNQNNYSIAQGLGLPAHKISEIGCVPGTGGVDHMMFAGVPLPSKKDRLILWPKAYNCIQCDGLAVVEALRLALPRIGEFHLIASAAIPDVEYWFKAFLGSYGSRVKIHDRLPREQLLEIYKTARVLLAPSLSDGVPNSMYEAMASHTVPILSPLETLLPLFYNNIHTIYAPNLEPPCIADALVCAMNNDVLADSIANTNRTLLPLLAGREAIRERVITMYKKYCRYA